jgi:hypothetical protein
MDVQTDYDIKVVESVVTNRSGDVLGKYSVSKQLIKNNFVNIHR